MIEKNNRDFQVSFEKICLERDQISIAIDLDVSAAYVNQIFRGKKNTSPKTQNSIAKKLGFTYESFLNYGKTPSVETEQLETKIDYIQDRIEKEHIDLIKRFKDKEAGKEANQFLIELEKLSVRDFQEIIGKIKGLVYELRQKQERLESFPPKEEENTG